MRHSKWLAAALLIGAAGLSACQRAETHGDQAKPAAPKLGRQPVRVIDRLDCPEKQGYLKRINVAPDGQSCAYATDKATVELRLVKLTSGDAESALTPIEAELKSVMPPPPPPPKPPNAKSKGHTSIHLPGVNIDSNEHGADIRIGHLTINSDGGAAEVKINKNVNLSDDDRKSAVAGAASDDEHGDGDVSINASNGGAEIKARKAGDNLVRSTFILANDKAPKGYRLAGYEARGPKGGPLAVAVVKAKTRDTGDHDIFKDMKALLRHNVGG